MTFKEYKGLDLVGTGSRILERWKKLGAFEKSLELREGAPEFIFFEGPPSANGMPGIHHVMARSIKDAVCRYKTQTGFKVRRRAGWDTHGLPVEIGVEKKLGIHKEDIGNRISVADYNATCRSEVMKYTAEWVNMTERIGYWVDMKEPYITYDNRYIETLWWLLKKIYDKGLLYKGYSIQPYSPSDGTGLSSHELNQPGCYKDVTDTTVTVQFEVEGEEGLYFLAWTTTPWTLPSNTALCVGPDIDYVKVRGTNPYSGAPATYIVARDLVSALFGEKTPHEVLPGSFKGRSLVGMRYKQLIPWFKPLEGDAFRVIAGDYVTTDEGTGIVHIAPTFGADDKKVAEAAGIPPMMALDREGRRQALVDRSGRFYPLEDLDPAYAAANVSPDYAEYAGRFVKNAFDDSLPADAPTLDIDLCVMLKQQGKAFKIQKHTHSYPHSWRTDKPVLYFPLDAWFIRATAVKEQMVALNKEITWKPESTGTGRFGQWLENIQDWNLSRSRFWGTPLPIWRTEDGKEEICIGSVKELSDEVDKAVTAGLMAENPFKAHPEKLDLHRPYVDELVLVSPMGRPMKRESDLIDVWFDSGAMPYAQTGLRDIDTPDFGATADFIAEGVDQTRGWFYTLHAIHTMVSGTPAFKRVISNGLVLDKNGDKMSKRLGNAVDPFSELDKFGPDALRWYMLTNAQPWDNLRFDEAGVDEIRRKFFGTLYNSYSLFAVYANIDGFDPAAPAVAVRPEFDRWMLSRLNTLVAGVRASYEEYDITTAGRLVQDFVCDDFSNWYLRLNKKRIWGPGMDDDKLSAYQTIYEVLRTVALLSAPIAPFYADELYTDLVPGAQSVHFERMPDADKARIDTELEARMALAQKASSMVLALRKKVGINVKQPLPKLLVPVTGEQMQQRLEAVRSFLLAEVNVKELEFVTDATGLITRKVKPNFRTLGKKYGPRMKEISAAFATLDQPTIAAMDRSEGDYSLVLPGGPVLLAKEDYEIHSEDMPGWLVASEGPLTLALDVALTPELVQEGTARELIRPIQNLRKETGLAVTDRIRTEIFAAGEAAAKIGESLSRFKDYVASQTLSTEVALRPLAEAPADAAEVEWDNTSIKIKITR